MATHSTILAWKIPWVEDPGGLQSMGFPRQEYYIFSVCVYTYIHTYIYIYREREREHTRTHTDTHTDIHKHTHTDIHTHTHIYTHMCYSAI